MKVLLRNRETIEYVGSDKWAVDPVLAFDFVKTGDAIAFCKENNLSEMEVVLRFDNPVSENAFSVE